MENKKPWDITRADFDKLWDNNSIIREGMPCDVSQESVQELGKFAQKKLLKYLTSHGPDMVWMNETLKNLCKEFGVK